MLSIIKVRQSMSVEGGADDFTSFRLSETELLRLMDVTLLQMDETEAVRERLGALEGLEGGAEGSKEGGGFDDFRPNARRRDLELMEFVDVDERK